MSQPPRDASAQEARPTAARETQILGLPTADLAGLSVDDLTGNRTAITMLVHYYKNLLDENSSLRNDLNTVKTYVESYEKKKTNSRVGAILLLVSNIGIGFGVNLLSANQSAAGWSTLVPSVVFAIAGTYFSLKDQ